MRGEHRPEYLDGLCVLEIQPIKTLPFDAPPVASLNEP
jgi:hypothetical protein